MRVGEDIKRTGQETGRTLTDRAILQKRWRLESRGGSAWWTGADDVSDKVTRRCRCPAGHRHASRFLYFVSKGHSASRSWRSVKKVVK